MTHLTFRNTMSPLVPPPGRCACRLPQLFPPPDCWLRRGHTSAPVQCQGSRWLKLGGHPDLVLLGALPLRTLQGALSGVWLVPFEGAWSPGTPLLQKASPESWPDTPGSKLGWSWQSGSSLGRGDPEATAAWTVSSSSCRGCEARPRSQLTHGHGPRGWESQIQRSLEEFPNSR